jgi:hypothetical protein
VLWSCYLLQHFLSCLYVSDRYLYVIFLLDGFVIYFVRALLEPYING